MTEEAQKAAEAVNTNAAETAAVGEAAAANTNEPGAAVSKLAHLKEEFHDWLCAEEREADDILAWLESKI